MSLPKILSCSNVLGMGWVSAGLTVVVAKILITAEEPEPLAYGRAAEVRGEVAVPERARTPLRRVGPSASR